MEEKGVSWFIWTLSIAAALLLWVVIPWALFIHLTSSDSHPIGLSITPAYGNEPEPMIACGEVTEEGVQIRSTPRILLDNSLGNLSYGEMLPILGRVDKDTDAVFNSNSLWYRVWWPTGGEKGFVYSEYIREVDFNKCLPKRPGVNH